MKTMKKVLSMLLVVALTATIAVNVTLAYLQDQDEDVNVMTLGNVKIEQIEQERDENGDLQDFTQAKPAFPAVGPIEWDDTGVKVNGTEYKVFTEELKNVVDKIVTVKNTGLSDAFVRTIVAIEAPGFDSNNLIHVNVNGDSVLTQTSWAPVVIDGVEYVYAVFTYTEALEPNEISAPSLMQVFLDSETTNEDVAAFGDAWEIKVLSQAIQTQGFADAATALNTGFGEATAENVKAWFADVDAPILADTADDLISALEDGDDVVLTEDVKIDPAGMSNAYGTTGINIKNGQTIDGGGNTLDIKGAGGTWDSGINTTGGTIKNITITGSFRGIFVNHNSTHSEPVVLENVTIDGTTYTISCDQGMNQTLTATNCTFKGWTSYAATLGEATFVDCYFGEGNGYAYMRPYAPTTFVGCEFEAGFEMDPCAAVTFENCTIGGVALTADNLATLVTSNIANATVK